MTIGFLFPLCCDFGYCDQRLALKRLVDISMGVITPLSEQLTKPLPNALVLVNLKELSTGAYKLLPQGAFHSLSPISLIFRFQINYMDLPSV